LSDPKRLEQMLGVSIAERWAAFPEAIPRGYEYLKTHPDALGWYTYLFIHAVDNRLVGYGGLKGVPDECGMVEIGYGIAPAYQNRGLATEAAQALIDYAFSHPQVKTVDAHTLAVTNPSTRVLEKVGMQYTGTLDDPDHGAVWHWRLSRADYQQRKL
jgi:RimJ/RimL family protein N-acetyltransferase